MAPLRSDGRFRKFKNNYKLPRKGLDSPNERGRIDLPANNEFSALRRCSLTI